VTDVAVVPGDALVGRQPLMFSIAYRMLGSVAEADLVVRDALARLSEIMREGRTEGRAEGVAGASPDAPATTVTMRLAVDALRSGRRRRERYAGCWLPEPLLDDAGDSDQDLSRGAGPAESGDTASVAFLVLLERLSPVERAVFLLREALGYGCPATAEVVGESEQNCRRLLARARRHIDAERPRFDPSPRRRAELAAQFFDAVRRGDVAGLERLLGEDVVFCADAGGNAPAGPLPPVRGPVRVARFLAGFGRTVGRFNVRFEPVRANGHPAARLSAADGDLLAVMGVDVAGGRVTAVHTQANPDKLGHLGRVGDLAALLHPAGTDQL
jgi:RNA polymerase sigma-70 factor (ECF subfamily)